MHAHDMHKLRLDTRFITPLRRAIDHACDTHYTFHVRPAQRVV